ncbi:MAG: antibiotic biosynthesis monooxygenase [Spirochaetes bacterium GWF1_51_8]|nr:MAG: antibiotic biosynthesis monooxygenase [Spirochaetes bacterium GWF1_51_8]
MIATCVTVYVLPEYVEQFIEATIENHRGSVMEPENLRFDVLRAKSDPCRFTLYEVYRTEAGAAAHKETAHYKKWKDTVAEWMAKPREGVAHDVIAPLDPEVWKTERKYG